MMLITHVIDNSFINDFHAELVMKEFNDVDHVDLKNSVEVFDSLLDNEFHDSEISDTFDIDNISSMKEVCIMMTANDDEFCDEVVVSAATIITKTSATMIFLHHEDLCFD